MRNVWSVTAILLATVLAGCAGTEETTTSFESIDAPAWAAGDAYAYNMTGLVGGHALVTVDGETVIDEGADMELPDQAMLVYEVLNTNFSADGPVYLAAGQFSEGLQFSLFGEAMSGLGKLPIAFRQDDLSPSAVELTQTQVCDPGCRLATSGFEVHDALLEPYVDFPLTPGKTWRNDLALPGQFADYGAFLNLHAEVIGMEPVEGPDGPVDAVRIVRDVSFPFDDDFVAFMATQSGQGLEDVDVHTDVVGQVVSHYAPSLGNVVSEAMKFEATLEIAFTKDGQQYESTITAAMDIVTYMAGYVAGSGVEYEGQALYDRFDDGLAVIDPTGAQSASYQVTITSDRSDFNVADGGVVNFNITTEPALREGDAIRYSLVNGRGSSMAVGSGDAFTATFQEAGLYGVYVQVTNEAGAIQALGETFVPVDFMGEVELLCGHAGASAVPSMGSCTAADVPIYNTLGLADVVIEAAGSVAAANGGQLEVSDEDGQTASTAANSGKGTLSLADLGDLTIDNRGWTATWTASQFVEPSMTIKMVLDYAVLDDAEPAESL